MFSNTNLSQIVSLVFCLMVMPLGIFVCKKLYDKIKSEEHKEKGKVVQIIIKNYCLIQMVAWPILFFFGYAILLNNDTLMIVDSTETQNAIHGFRFLYSFFRTYISFHSLVIAATRYLFVMYDLQTEIFGVSKLKKIFIFSSVGIPFLHTILYEATSALEARWLYLFAVHNESVSIPSKKHSMFFNQVLRNEEDNILLYNIITKCLPSPVIIGIKIVESTFFILVSMNIIECFLYTHIFVHFNR